MKLRKLKLCFSSPCKVLGGIGSPAGFKVLIGLLGVLVLSVIPSLSQAQDITTSLQGMQPVLNHVYDEMIPMCSKLIDAARGIAGFAALWYIASRVWRQIAQAEPLDFYPLLRPFALGIAVMLFPMVISLMNGIMLYIMEIVTTLFRAKLTQGLADFWVAANAIKARTKIVI